MNFQGIMLLREAVNFRSTGMTVSRQSIMVLAIAVRFFIVGSVMIFQGMMLLGDDHIYVRF